MFLECLKLDKFVYLQFSIEYILLLIKVASYYGLLSTSPITSPVPTGKMINIPIHSACMFAAYPGRSKEEVKIPFN